MSSEPVRQRPSPDELGWISSEQILSVLWRSPLPKDRPVQCWRQTEQQESSFDLSTSPSQQLIKIDLDRTLLYCPSSSSATVPCIGRHGPDRISRLREGGIRPEEALGLSTLDRRAELAWLRVQLDTGSYEYKYN